MSVNITRSWGEPGSKITVTFQLEPSEIRDAAKEYELGRLETRSRDAVNAWLDRNGFPRDLASRPELFHAPAQILERVLNRRDPAVAENDTIAAAAEEVIVPAIRELSKLDYWTEGQPYDIVTNAALGTMPIEELRELMWRSSWRNKYNPKRDA